MDFPAVGMVHFEPEGGIYPAVGMAPFGSELSSRAIWQKRTKINSLFLRNNIFNRCKWIMIASSTGCFSSVLNSLFRTKMQAGKTLLASMQPMGLLINQLDIIYGANQFADATGTAVLADMKFRIALMYAFQPSIVEEG